MASVIVGVSGGVDSAVAVILLQEAGHEVCGVTVNTCGAGAVWKATHTAARRVCDELGITHVKLDLASAFNKNVIGDFVRQYGAGRTPNPCVVCNPGIKWSALLQYAEAQGYEYVATGHYARVDEAGGRWRLQRGVDRSKDQSYMLYRLQQRQLSHTILPLGDYTKEQVREIARAHGLHAADAGESQDICFIPDGDYKGFLRGRMEFRPGPIVDREGHVFGEHQGLAMYTVGQRKGLGVGGHRTLHVVAKDAQTNVLIVGSRDETMTSRCELSSVNWVSVAKPEDGATVQGEFECRYRTGPVAASLTVRGNGAEVELAEPRVCAPGQSGVLYDGDTVLAGGFIEA